VNDPFKPVVDALHEAMGDKRYTTKEMEDMLIHLFGYRCPDDLTRYLNKLKMKGVVCGAVDRERACFMWWLPSKEDQPE